MTNDANYIQQAERFVRSAYRKALHQVFRFGPDGTNIYERDWDVLVVLDACRYDLFQRVASDYDFRSGLSSITSVDTMTPEWMRATFVDEYAAEIAETQYVCGNPFSAEALEKDRFHGVDEVWKYAWDDELGTVHPEPVTDRAVHHGRNTEADRLLVHYIQPHWPFVPAPELTNNSGMTIDSFGTYNPNNVWERLRNGEVSEEEVWEGYEQNLRYVLDSVETLLDNVGAKNVVVTSDHGNAFGEWGIYGHPMHMPLECLRRVPWIETTATDEQSLKPNDYNTCEPDTEEIEDRLTALGYQ